MEWNDDIIVRLRALWTEGHSTAEIGRRIGVSKNAVVGKAHRLGLDARPSPIRRDDRIDGIARPPVARRAVGPTLPPLPADHPPSQESGAPSNLVETTIAGPVVQPVPTVSSAPMAPVAPAVRAVSPRPSRLVACCWPIGEPGTPSFHFCDDDALHGKPYCAKHATLAYVKVRERREEAA